MRPDQSASVAKLGAMASSKLPPGVVKTDAQTYRATVRHGRHGTRETRTFATAAEATAWKAGREMAKGRGRGRQSAAHDRAAARLTVADAWHRWRAAPGLEQSTLAAYDSYWANHVEPMLGRVKLVDLTPLLLDSWLTHIETTAGLSPATEHRVVNMLSTVLKRAKRDRLIDDNPTRAMRARRKAPQHDARVLTPAELDQLLSAGDERFRAFWLTLALTGARWGEAAAVPVRNVDLDAGTLVLYPTMNRDGSIKAYPKGRKPRTVALADPLIPLLKPLVDGRRFDELVFTTVTGRPLGYHTMMSRVWRPMVAAAGLPDPQPTPHDLRHSAATWLGAQGFTARQIADLLGHGSVRTTERYVHATSETVIRHRDAFSRLGF